MDDRRSLGGCARVLSHFCSSSGSGSKRGDRRPKGATQAAREAAESAEKAQRVQVRPALRLEWDERPLLPANKAPILLSRVAHHIGHGHGTASIEHIRLLEHGNLRVELHDTRGMEQRLIEQFDQLFQVLMGVRMDTIPVELSIPPLTDVDRGLGVGASGTLTV